jgi:hypothetical protein
VLRGFLNRKSVSFAGGEGHGPFQCRRMRFIGLALLRLGPQGWVGFEVGGKTFDLGNAHRVAPGFR